MANKKATRESYGEALAFLADENKDIVVLDADLSKSTKTELFQKKAPERFANAPALFFVLPAYGGLFLPAFLAEGSARLPSGTCPW